MAKDCEKYLIEKLKLLHLYFIRCSYFVFNKYFSSDKIKTKNGNIYSRKLIKQMMDEYNKKQNKNFGEIRH